MASTYSTSLKLTLPGDGDQAGLWGQTTNTNLGTLLEQAITGVQSITMFDANYTLTSFNGITDEARNAVLVVTGTNNAVRDLIPPVVKKLYTIVNSTTGGFAIRVIGASGTGVNIPSGATCLVYCDGTNFVNGLSGTSGNFTVNGALGVTSTSTLSGATTFGAAITYGGVTLANAVTGTGNMVLSASPTFTGTPLSTTAANGTNTTQIATTAFVNAAVTTVIGTLGTMSSQNANAVTITGGTLNGVTGTNAGLTVGTATNATTSTTQTAGTNNTSIATTAFVQAATFGSSAQSWSDVSGSRSIGSSYTNSTGKAISVAVSGSFPPATSLTGVVGGVTVVFTGARANTEIDFITFIVPDGATYSVNQSGGTLYSYTWAELR
jgi:hypothetical protein